MRGGKYALGVCVLCLFVGFSALAHAQIKSNAAPKAQGARVNEEPSRTEQINETLIAAVDAESIGAMEKALASGADINGKDREGMTPLMHAALRGNQEIVEFLLKRRARVDLVDIFGVTALMQASWAGHAGIVADLVTAGADPDLQSYIDIPRLKKKGVNALIGASMNGNIEIVKILLEKGAKVNQQDAEGQTALIHASKNGFPDVVELLLSQGAKMEIKDQFGRTALTVATIHNQIEVVQILLEAGANVFTKDTNNLKPIVYASALDHGEIYAMLKSVMLRRPPVMGTTSFRRAPQPPPQSPGL
jgi:ankyrin repeat protein